eukprot:1161995-Pelagomonas_calceolata.AAC.4
MACGPCILCIASPSWPLTSTSFQHGCDNAIKPPYQWRDSRLSNSQDKQEGDKILVGHQLASGGYPRPKP